MEKNLKRSDIAAFELLSLQFSGGTAELTRNIKTNS
jgi:hypothetical protein